MQAHARRAIAFSPNAYILTHMRTLIAKMKSMTKQDWLLLLKKAVFFLIPYLVMITVSFVPLIAWWRESETIPTGQDIVWHLIWVEDLVYGWQHGFYGLSTGHHLLGNLGYNVYLFYGSLSHHATALFAVMGMRVIDAWRLVGYLSVLLSGFWTYHLALLLCKKNKPLSLAFGLLFIFLPYRYTNFLVRAAYPEGVAMGFAPLLFLGIFHILKDEEPRVRGYIYAILGAAGLILSHPFTSFLVGLAAVFVVVANFKDLLRIGKLRRTWIYLSISAFLLFCLIAMYLIPMAQALNSGIYRVSDEQAMWMTIERVIKCIDESSVSFSGFIAPGLLTRFVAEGSSGDTWLWDILLFFVFAMVGLVAHLLWKRYVPKAKIVSLPLAMAITCSCLFISRREELVFACLIYSAFLIIFYFYERFYDQKQEGEAELSLKEELKLDAKNPTLYVLIVLFVICFLFVFTEFIWRIAPSMFRKGQFPFRYWGTISILFVLIVLFIAKPFKRFKYTKYYVALIACTLYVSAHAPLDKRLYQEAGSIGPGEPTISYVESRTRQGSQNEYMPNVFYDDTHVSAYSNSLYTTIKQQVRQRKGFAIGAEQYIVPVFLEGDGTIALESLNTPNAVFQVTVTSESAYVQLPQFYYEGYVATLSNETKTYSAEGENVDGLVSFRLQQGDYQMDVVYLAPKSYRILHPFLYIGIVGIVLFAASGIVVPRIMKKREEKAQENQ